MNDPHTGFIVASYVAAVVVLVGMIAATILDYRRFATLWRVSGRSSAARPMPAMTAEPQPAAHPRRRSWLAFVPGVIFLGLAGLFFVRLYAGDASRLPSALIGRPVPVFTLPPVDGLEGRPGLTDADLRDGKVTVVNVFASWCVPCRDEHPVLMELAKDVRLVGIAYKDDPENTRRFLNEGGDPFSRIGADRSGRTGIDWGVYGVPETYVVKGDGTIAFKYVGPLTDAALQATLLPEIAKAKGAS